MVPYKYIAPSRIRSTKAEGRLLSVHNSTSKPPRLDLSKYVSTNNIVFYTCEFKYILVMHNLFFGLTCSFDFQNLNNFLADPKPGAFRLRAELQERKTTKHVQNTFFSENKLNLMLNSIVFNVVIVRKEN